MSKKIQLNFNENGVLVNTEIDQIRQGDANITLVASFEGKNNVNYVARYTFTRPDGKVVKGIMNASAETTKYEKVLDSAYYFAVDGASTLTIFLFSGSEVLAQGQATISIEKTDFSEETTITTDEYNELIQILATKLGIKDTILKVDNVVQIGNLTNYNVGQCFFILDSGLYFQQDYILNHTVIARYNGQKLVILFDITEARNKQVDHVNVAIGPAKSLITVAIDIINKEGESIAYGEEDLPSATQNHAGLMSAQDKKALDNVPNELKLLEEKLGAHKLSKNAQGDNFETEEELTTATVFYYRGEVHTPDENDFAIVNEYGEEGNKQPARFSFDGEEWTFDFLLNSLTIEQQKALNSGVSAEWVDNVDRTLGEFADDLEQAKTDIEGKSTVSVSTEKVEGATTVKSIKVNGTDYNIGAGEGGGAVDSVNGKTGVVVITAQDIALEGEDKTVEDKIIEQDATAEDLQDQVNNLKSRGRYLSNWNATTGLPVTDPSTELPYVYRQGDYFIVGTVGETNYKPTGSEYTGDPSTEVETIALAVGDEYIYDGEEWVFQKNAPIDLSGYVQKTDIATSSNAGVIKLANGVKTLADGIVYADTYTKQVYDALSEHTFIGKGTLDNVLSPIKEGTINVINASDIATTGVLTDEQIESIKNHKITAIDGVFSGYHNPILLSKKETASLTGIVLAIDNGGVLNTNFYTINLATKKLTIGVGYVSVNQLTKLNNKTFPAYSKGYFVYDGTNLKWIDNSVTEISTATYNGSIASSKDYKFTVPATSITIASCEPQTGDLQPMWSLTFEAGENCSLTLPEGAKWVGGTAPTFTSGKIYTVVIKTLGTNLLAVSGEF